MNYRTDDTCNMWPKEVMMNYRTDDTCNMWPQDKEQKDKQ